MVRTIGSVAVILFFLLAVGACRQYRRTVVPKVSKTDVVQAPVKKVVKKEMATKSTGKVQSSVPVKK